MRRAHFLSLLPLLGALAGTSLGQTTAARRTESLLPYLPEGTIAAISVPDIDASLGELSSMPLAKMWHEKEVQDFVQDAKDMLMQHYQKALTQAKEMHKAGQLPIDPEKLANLRVKGMSLAVTSMHLEVGDFGPMPEFGLMLQFDFGESAQEWFGLAQMGLGVLAQTGKVEREDIKVGSADVVCLTPKKAPPGLKMGLNVAMAGNSLIIGTLRDELRTTLENMQKGTAVLTATARYQESRKHLTIEGAETEFFMRVDPLLDFAIEGLKLAAEHESELSWLNIEGVGRAIDALGIRGIRSVAAVSSYQDGKAVSTSYVVAPAPDRKGLLAGANKKLDMSFLKWVPKDAVGFSAASLEAMTVYDALVAAVNAYDPKMGEMVLGKLAEMEKKVGFNLRDDLFGALGDTMIHWSMPMASFATPPELAVLVKVNDQEKVVKVLKALTGMSEGMVELDEADKRGVKTYQFRLNFDPTHGMGGMNPLDMFNPCFSFKDGWLVAGFSPSDIRQVFKRMERTEDDPKTDIRGNKEFVAYASSLPADLQSVSFTDWKAEFESYYQMLGGLLAFLPQNEDIPFDMSRLPDASTLTKHLFGALSYSTADASGMKSTTISPFGPEVAVLFAGAIAAAIGVAVSMRARF
jgi:hypothetical protein